MNREIEFRAWSESYKAILEVDLLGKNKILSSRTWLDIKDIELMQYTGIKDKNGVKIFEGDVFIDEDGCIGVVRYSEQYAWFIIEWYENSHSKEPIDDDALGNINIHNMEVIGNIYENKELLEDE